MESALSSSLLLKDFLDVFPKSALILTPQSQQLSGDSFKVCYANQAFLDIIGDEVGGPKLAEENSLTSILKAKCIHPTMSRFIKWIDSVLQNPRAGHGLRTSFQGSEIVGEGPATAHRKIVYIKWKALVLKETYVILTGKTTGSSSYFTGGKGPVASRPSVLRMPAQMSTHSIDSIESPPAISAVSPGSSTGSVVGTEISSPSYFTEAFTEREVTSPKGLDPWRHTEKVPWPVARDDCRF